MTIQRDDSVDVYLKVIERLEPDLTMIDHDAGIASIAISLKRIADAQDRQLNMFEHWYQNVIGRSLP